MSDAQLDHPQAEQAAAYALGSLDAGEVAAFEAHLAGCASCRADVAEFRAVADQIAPTMRPPDALRDRVLREALQAPPPADRRVVPLPVPSRRAEFAPWVAVAASLVVVVGLLWQLQRARADTDAALNSLAAAEDRVRDAESLAAQRDSLLRIVLAPTSASTRLTATGQPPSVRLTWNAEARVIIVSAADLPPAPAGRTYQLWGLPTRGTPVSLGTFNTAPGDAGYVILNVAGELPALNGSAVTEEPVGGSPQPTSTPFLVGPWATQ